MMDLSSTFNSITEPLKLHHTCTSIHDIYNHEHLNVSITDTFPRP